MAHHSEQDAHRLHFDRFKIPHPLTNGKSILVAICLIYSVILLWYSCVGIAPAIYGDGHEYLGITSSFYNHLSPDLRQEDIIFREDIENRNGIYISERYDFTGYFETTSGRWYSYHFWAYSLLNLPVFTLLHTFSLNELLCFQITNSLILLLSLWAIVLFSQLPTWKKFWLFMLAALNPALFYIPWVHPEIFSYSFVLLSVIFTLNHNLRTAVLMSSIASLQNPPIAVITLFLVLVGWRGTEYNYRELLTLLVISSISTIPYIFYYMNYGTFSLITLSGASNISYITLNKIGSLFFDPNFGLLPYFPILLPFTIISTIISVQKRKWYIPQLWGVLFLIALIGSTQGNWNCGMMYIHRYAVYMIPIVILIAMLSMEYFSRKTISAAFATSVILAAAIMGILFVNYNCENCITHNELSNNILTIAPMAYNPPLDVFAERAIRREGNYYDYLPIIYAYDGRPRKILTDYQHISEVEGYIDPRDKDKIISDIGDSGIGYINFGPLWEFPIDTSKITIYHTVPSNECIIGNPTIYPLVLFNGWHGLEDWNGIPTRWMQDTATLGTLASSDITATLNFSVTSFHHPRNLEIYVNNQLAHRTTVPISSISVSIPIQLHKGENIIRLHVPEGAERPCDIFGLNNKDTRWLSVAVQNVTILKAG